MPVRDSVTAIIKEKSTDAPSPAGMSANERHCRFSTASHKRCHSGSRHGSVPAGTCWIARVLGD